MAVFCGSEMRVWTVRAHVAAHAFRALAGALETREEAKLPPTTAVKNVKAARDWSAAHGWKPPSSQALRRKGVDGDDKESAEEAKVAYGLNSWKHRGKEDREACDFLMRHAGWWKAFADVSQKEKAADLTSKVNSMIKEGHGSVDEPHFEGKKKWPSGADGSDVRMVYNKMRRMVDGHYYESYVDSMLEGVDEARAEWYRGKADAKRSAYKEAMKKGCEESVSRGKEARKRARGDE
jgi:hypothetical protein